MNRKHLPQPVESIPVGEVAKILYLCLEMWDGGEQIVRLREIFLALAKEHEDESALLALQLLRQAWDEDEESRPHRWEQITGEFRVSGELRKLYWEIPDARRKRLDSLGGPCPGEEIRPVLLKTKAQLIRWIIENWDTELSPENVEVFRFICAAFEPPRLGSMSNFARESSIGTADKESAAGRFVSAEEKKVILDTLRLRLEDRAGIAGQLDRWLTEVPDAPREIRRRLALARAHAGGETLAMRDIRYAELLARLNPEKRSAGALEAHAQFSARLAEFDTDIHYALAVMQALGQGWTRVDSQQVPDATKAQLEFDPWGLNWVVLRLEVRDWGEEVDRALVQDIAGRIRRWMEQLLQRRQTESKPNPGRIEIIVTSGVELASAVASL